MTTSATAVAAAAVAAEEETRKNLTSTTTCSKVLYNNAHCGQPVVSSSVDYCTVRYFVYFPARESNIRET